MITNVGLAKLAQNFSEDVTQAQWGSGTATPSPADTSLESPLGDTLHEVTGTASNGSIQFTHTTLSTESVGQSLTEHELIYDNNKRFSKVKLKSGIAKGDDCDYQTTTIINFVKQ